jgi:hypothetical protein
MLVQVLRRSLGGGLILQKAKIVIFAFCVCRRIAQEDFCDDDNATAASLVNMRNTNVS